MQNTTVLKRKVIIRDLFTKPINKIKSAKFTFEIALLAEGAIGQDVYSILRSPQGVERALKKLEEIDTLTDEDIGILKAKVDSYIKSKDEKIRKQSININFITSRENNYKNILINEIKHRARSLLLT